MSKRKKRNLFRELVRGFEELKAHREGKIDLRTFKVGRDLMPVQICKCGVDVKQSYDGYPAFCWSCGFAQKLHKEREPKEDRNGLPTKEWLATFRSEIEKEKECGRDDLMMRTFEFLFKTANKAHELQEKVDLLQMQKNYNVLVTDKQSVPLKKLADVMALSYVKMLGCQPKTVSWLNGPELELISLLADAHERFVAGSVNHEKETVLFVTAKLGAIDVPFSWFTPSGDGVRPDFNKLEITDYGRTVALGEYEADVLAILAEGQII